MLASIVALIKAVPIIDQWFQQLAAAYLQMQIDSMKKENLDAIRKLIDAKDQRDFEKALGASKAGLPSGDDGATIVDSIPGVH